MTLMSVAWGSRSRDRVAAEAPSRPPFPSFSFSSTSFFTHPSPSRNAQKKLKTMLEALKKGDKIVTSSGLWGTITNMAKETVTVQIADNTKIKVQRDHICSPGEEVIAGHGGDGFRAHRASTLFACALPASEVSTPPCPAITLLLRLAPSKYDRAAL